MTSIVMTGATTGLGRVAATHLLTRPGSHLTVGARGASSLPSARVLPLDLASLASVRLFVAQIEGEVDVLVLNAGGQRPGVDTRTVDGLETTFATNHLAHYLLLRLLMPKLAPDARVVITSSGTHDPREGADKVGVPAPRHADARRLAYPETDPGVLRRALPAGMQAYSSSKLCDVMTALTLAEQPEAADWTVTAYDPGLTPGTGLVRDQALFVRVLAPLILPLIRPFASGMNSLAAAGRGLAVLATDTVLPPGRVYGALRKARLIWPDPSELAQDPVARTKLWNDSAELVSL